MMHEGVRRRSSWDEEMLIGESYKDGPPSAKKLRRPDPPACPGQDLICNLPDECMHLIFSLLPSPRDRCACATVSRKWLLLQAHMRPSDFRSLSTTTTLSSPPDNSCGDDARKEGTEESRCLNSHKANDARLAAMAVAACARGGPKELVVRATTFHSDLNSPLLAVSDMGLCVISQACPELRSLVLWDCVQVDNEGLAAVARNCRALETLHLSNAPLVDDEGLTAIALNCPKLSNLSLGMCPRVGDGAVRSLAMFSSNLESIGLDNCPLVRDAGLFSLFSSLPRLAKVRIADAKVGDTPLEAIGARGEGNSIRALYLENVTGCTHVGFRRLGMAVHLQSLTVSNCAGLDDSCFDIGDCGTGWGGPPKDATFAGLRSLTVRCCGALTDGGLIQLSESSRHMESLQLEKCHSVTATGLIGAVGNWAGTLRLLSLVKCNGIGRTRLEHQPQWEQEAIPVPVRCPLLQSLTIKRCPRIGDELLSVFGRALVRPRRLNVMGIGSVTDKGFISFFASMESGGDVQSVDLSGCPGLTDWSVAALVSASGRALRRLSLEGCDGVTDRSLKMIGLFCPRLVELHLSGCRHISDGGVAGLLASGDCPVAGEEARGRSSGRKSQLQVLSLEGCGGITDESLSSLEEMVVGGSLAGLNLKHCGGLSRASIDTVRQTLWWCDLIY